MSHSSSLFPILILHSFIANNLRVVCPLSLSIMYRICTISLCLFLAGMSLAQAQWVSLGDSLVPENFHSNDIQTAPDGSIWNVSGVNAFPPTGTSPVVNRSTDGGITWTTTTASTIADQWPFSIAPVDSMKAWMACDENGLYSTSDGGTTWSQDTAYGKVALDVHFFSPDSGWVFGYDTTDFLVRHSVTSDGGQTWTHISSGPGPTPPGTSVPPFDSTEIKGFGSWITSSGISVTGDIIVIGSSKGYWMSTDRGYNWTRRPSPNWAMNFLPSNIVVKDSNTVMIVSDYDTTYGFRPSTVSFTTRDGGQTWTEGYPDVSVSMTVYVPGTPGTCILGGLVSTGGVAGTAITYDMGNTWYTIDQTRSIGTLEFLSDSVGYASCANGPFGVENSGHVYQWDFDCVVTTSVEDTSVCQSYTWALNGETYTVGGSYIDTVQSSFGCDSIVTLNLTLTGPETDVTVNGNTLLAKDIPSSTTHQWLRCDDGFAPIPGAIVTIFSATESGQYAVEFTDGDCVDTSACYTVCFAIEDTITTAGDSLVSGSEAMSYQWIDCNNGNAPITGATDRRFLPDASGIYAVVVTSSIGCTDTLPCVDYILNSLPGLTAQSFDLFPNPVQNQLTISLPDALLGKPLEFQVVDVQGRSIQHQTGTYPSGEVDFELSDLSPGLYLIQVVTPDQAVSLRFVKQ